MTTHARDGAATFSGVVAMDDLSESQRNEACVGSAPSPLEVAEVGSDRRALSRAIEQLDPRERTIVNLHYFQGVRLKTIAAQLGVSDPRVSQLHAHAMLRLRALLAQDEPALKAA